MNLKQIINNITLSEFKKLFSCGKSFIKLQPLGCNFKFDLDNFENLIWTNEKSISLYLKVYRDGVVITPPRRPYSKDLFRWAIDQFENRNILCFENIQQVLPWAANLAGEVANKLIAKIQVDSILIPGNSKGDFCLNAESCLIIQTHGFSTWNFEKKYENEDKFVRLSKGDILFVPRKQNISISASNSDSLFLIVNILPYTVNDFLQVAIEHAVENDPLFRKTIPLNSEFECEFSNALNKVYDSLMTVEKRVDIMQLFLLRISDEHRIVPGGHLMSASKSEFVTLDSTVMKREGTNLVLINQDDRVYLFVPGLGNVPERQSQPGGLIFPPKAKKLLNQIINFDQPFKPRELLNIYSDSTKLHTVKKLVSLGALRLLE